MTLATFLKFCLCHFSGKLKTVSKYVNLLFVSRLHFLAQNNTQRFDHLEFQNLFRLFLVICDFKQVWCYLWKPSESRVQGKRTHRTGICIHLEYSYGGLSRARDLLFSGLHSNTPWWVRES